MDSEQELAYNVLEDIVRKSPKSQIEHSFNIYYSHIRNKMALNKNFDSEMYKKVISKYNEHR